MADYIDIHSHRQENSIGSVLTIFNMPFSSNKIPENIFFSIGCHPWNVKEISAEKIELQLKSFLQKEKLIAIGEIGLDRHIDSDIELQKIAFKTQLDMACTFNKPTIIHCVRAYSDLLNTLKNENINIPLILHNYNGNSDQTERLLKFNCYFSFGKSLFQNRPKLEKTFQQIPLSRLFLETDESEISIQAVYAKAAEIRNIPLQQLMNQLKQNFIVIFGENILSLK
jgi:TatD DNase family protein